MRKSEANDSMTTLSATAQHPVVKQGSEKENFENKTNSMQPFFNDSLTKFMNFKANESDINFSKQGFYSSKKHLSQGSSMQPLYAFQDDGDGSEAFNSVISWDTTEEKASEFEEENNIWRDNDAINHAGPINFSSITRATPVRGTSASSVGSVPSNLGLSKEDKGVVLNMSSVLNDLGLSLDGFVPEEAPVDQYPIQKWEPCDQPEPYKALPKFSEGLVPEEAPLDKYPVRKWEPSDQSVPYKPLPKFSGISRPNRMRGSSDQSTPYKNLPKFFNMPQPVLLREASNNVHDGQGIEACGIHASEANDKQVGKMKKSRSYSSLILPLWSSIPRPVRKREKSDQSLSYKAFPKFSGTPYRNLPKSFNMPHPVQIREASNNVRNGQGIEACGINASEENNQKVGNMRKSRSYTNLSLPQSSSIPRPVRKREKSDAPVSYKALPKLSGLSCPTELKGSSDQPAPHSNLPSFSKMSKPVMLREASENVYDGQAIEAFGDSLGSLGTYRSLFGGSPVPAGDKSIIDENEVWKNFTEKSLDDFQLSLKRSGDIDSIASFDGLTECASREAEPVPQCNDAWDVLKDEFAIDHEGEDIPSFHILGTGVDDESAKPHVLSPPLMDALKFFLPYSVAEHNFWLKYSLVRDGGSLQTLMQYVRGASHTVLAIETVDGEVLGSFTSKPWRKQPHYFGTGEAFLWKMHQNRNTPCYSMLDKVQLESNVDVYPWTGKNYFVQHCPHDRIALGGGQIDEVPQDFNVSLTIKSGGFGIALDEDLLRGTSDPCATFDNPRLISGDDGVFEVANIEIWALTPCINEEEAEKLELSNMFFEKARRRGSC